MVPNPKARIGVSACFFRADSRRAIFMGMTKTNSVRHQAAEDIGGDLVVEAWSESDGVVPQGATSRLDDTPIRDGFPARGRH